MNTINLKKIEIQNFKGIKKDVIEFGDYTSITGGNAQKKSSIYEAYLWCLFGKNAKGEVANIQPRDIDGEIIHKITPSVKITLSINNIDVIIGKELNEVWSVPRGTKEEVFKGTTTTYLYNDVPLLMKEFNDKLNSICDIDTWLMCSDINSFFRLKVEDRRATLIKLAGDISDIELAEGFPLVKKALEENKSIEEYKRQVQAIKKKSKERLEEIPSKIDAQDKLIEELDFAKLRQEKEIKETELKNIENSLEKNAQESSFDDINKAQNNINNIDNAIIKKRFEITAEANRKEFTLQKDITLIKDQLIYGNSDLESNKKLLADTNIKLQEIAKEKDTLRNKWIEENNREYEDNSICSECGQEYPQELKDKALETFNESKVKRLKAIEEEAKKLEKEIKENILSKQQELENLIAIKENSLKELSISLEQKNNEKAAIPNIEDIINSNKEIIGLTSNLEKAKYDLEKAKERNINLDLEERNNKLREDKKNIKVEIERLINELSKEDFNKKIRLSKQQLNQECKTLAQEVASLENAEFQILEFQKHRINTIEQIVSSNFKLVQWKMYEQNKTNDGEKAICEAYVNGTPFSETNEAMTMLIGVDIINGLSKAKEIQVPLFIDRFESLETLPNIDTQLITLEVAKGQELEIKIINK